MRVIISGASGLLGTALTRALRRRRSRDGCAGAAACPVRARCNGTRASPLDPAKLAGCDAVVHLAGKNIAGRWTAKFKQEVMESRSLARRVLATAAAESFRRTGTAARLSSRRPASATTAIAATRS